MYIQHIESTSGHIGNISGASRQHNTKLTFDTFATNHTALSVVDNPEKPETFLTTQIIPTFGFNRSSKIPTCF